MREVSPSAAKRDGGRFAVQLAKALDGVCALSAARSQGVVDQFDLPRAEDM